MPEESEYFLSGTIVTANPKTLTCDLMKTDGGMLYGVPIADTTGGLFSNDINWNSNLRGAICYYTYIDGCPYVMGTLPAKVTFTDKISVNASETETGGDNDMAYGSATTSSYSSGRETDYQPNDKVIASDGDSKIALMSDGGVLLKASPESQIIMGGGMDFIKMVCREFSLFSDFGEMKFSHGSPGRTGLTIKGGAVYDEEAQADAGTNTVFMHLGDTEDAPEVRFGVRVTSTDAGEFGALAMGKDGRLIFTTSKRYLLMVGEDKHTLVDGDTFTQLKGDHIVEVSGDQKVDLLQNETLNVSQKRDITVGSDQNSNVGGDKNLQVQGLLNIGCSGLNISSYGGGSGQACMIMCSSLDIIRA